MKDAIYVNYYLHAGKIFAGFGFLYLCACEFELC